MPLSSTSASDLADDWEEVHAPFGPSKDDLARINLVFHDDPNLKAACILAYQHISQLSTTDKQDDTHVAETLRLVLDSLEQTTHELAMTREARDDLVAQIIDERKDFTAAMRLRDRHTSEELGKAARHMKHHIEADLWRERDLQDTLDASRRDVDILLAYQRDLVADRDAAVAQVQIIMGEAEDQYVAMKAELEGRLAEWEGENARLGGLVDLLAERDEEIKRLNRQCVERRERADMWWDMVGMNEGNECGKWHVDVGVQADMGTAVDEMVDKGKRPMSRVEEQFDSHESYLV